MPRQAAAGLDAALWSIVYMPQVRGAATGEEQQRGRSSNRTWQEWRAVSRRGMHPHCWAGGPSGVAAVLMDRAALLTALPTCTAPRRCHPPARQVGFVVRLEGGRLPAHLEEQLPDYQFAFEGSGGEEVSNRGRRPCLSEVVKLFGAAC